MLPFDKWMTVQARFGAAAALGKRVFFTDGSDDGDLVMADFQGNVLDNQSAPAASRARPANVSRSMWGRYFLRDVATNKVYYATNRGVYPITISEDARTFTVGSALFEYSGSGRPSGLQDDILTIPNVYNGNFVAIVGDRGRLDSRRPTRRTVYSEAGAGVAGPFWEGWSADEYPGQDSGNNVAFRIARQEGHYGTSGLYGWELANRRLFDGILSTSTSVQLRAEIYSETSLSPPGSVLYNLPLNTCSFGLLTGKTDGADEWEWLVLTLGTSRVNPVLGFQTFANGELSDVSLLQGTLPEPAVNYTPAVATVTAGRFSVDYYVGFGTMAVVDPPATAMVRGFDLRVREIDTSYSGPRTIYDGEGRPASVTRGEATSIIVLDNPPASVYQDGQLSFEYDGSRYILRDLVRNGEYEDLWDATFRRVRI